jgi:hypothetical protein
MIMMMDANIAVFISNSLLQKDRDRWRGWVRQFLK